MQLGYIPQFIPSIHGDLFTLYYESEQHGGNDTSKNSKPTSEAILFFPPFAEELNKSRHMVAKQAQSFCHQGYSVLIVDLFGTGDSSGNFSDATWDVWLDNIQTAIQWLKEQGKDTFSFWTLRSGHLLALDFMDKKNFPIDKLICWQPVLNGENFVMQFLRLRTAAAMMNKDSPKEKTSDLKSSIIQGQHVEVAGYNLNPELVIPLLAVKASSLNFKHVNLCHIFEISSSSESSINFVTEKWAQQINNNLDELTTDIIQGVNFWSTQEISDVPTLIDRTTRRMISE